MLKEAGGADVILDNMGASYLGRNVSALATAGRLVIIGMQGGAKGELDINALLRKRSSVTATSLRARPLAEKAQICCGVVENVWPLVASGAGPPHRRDHAPARGRRPRPPADGRRRALREDRPHPLDPAAPPGPEWWGAAWTEQNRGRMTEQQDTGGSGRSDRS